METAFSVFKWNNEQLFANEENVETAILEEMKNLSESLTINEKIDRASKILYWDYTSNKTAYLAMKEQSWGNFWTGKKGQEKESSEIGSIFDWILNSQKAKLSYLSKFK